MSVHGIVAHEPKIGGVSQPIVIVARLLGWLTVALFSVGHIQMREVKLKICNL